MRVQELLDCLHREIEIAQRIVEQLGAQHRALLELDLAGLEASVPVLDGLSAELAAAGQRRLEVVRALAAGQELPADAPLGAPAALLPEPARGELEQARVRLAALLEDIYHQNHANYLLILNAARFNRAILQYIAGTTATYAQDGAAGEAGASAAVLLDRKA